MSRQGVPARKRHMIALKWRRRSGIGPVAASGRWGSISSHSASVTSPRVTPQIYQAGQVLRGRIAKPVIPTPYRPYTSWAEFSAGYILGRCLHFDDGEFGHWYTTPLEVHHTM